MWLVNDTVTAPLGPLVPGPVGTVENSQCLLDAGGSRVSGAGTDLTVDVALSFKSSFVGSKTIWSWAMDSSAAVADWRTLGAWTTIQNLPPSSTSVSPMSGAGTVQAFRFVFSDPNGFQDLKVVQMAVHNATLGYACWVEYDRDYDRLWLVNDTVTAPLGPLTPGVLGTVENSQCKIDAASSTISGAGLELTVNVSVIFKPAFAGPHVISLWAMDVSGAIDDWRARGTWAVP